MLYRSHNITHESSSGNTNIEQIHSQYQIEPEPSSSLLGTHLPDLDLSGLKLKEVQVLKTLRSKFQVVQRFIYRSQTFLQHVEEAKKALADRQQFEEEEEEALQQEYSRQLQALKDTKARIEGEVTESFPRYSKNFTEESVTDDTTDPIAVAHIAAFRIYQSCVEQQIKPFEDSVKELQGRITAIANTRARAAEEVTDIEKLIEEVSAKKEAAKAMAKKVQEAKGALSRYIEAMWETEGKP
jgi:DNA repair exonuclease SbcCD ATPase subunit